MSISNRSVPFTESLVAAAPHAPGVFALWQGGGIVYYGRAAPLTPRRVRLPEGRSGCRFRPDCPQ